MPGFELHFTDGWLTVLFALAVIGYIYMFRAILNNTRDVKDCLNDMKLDIARIKIVLRLNTDKKIIKPERFQHVKTSDADV